MTLVSVDRADSLSYTARMPPGKNSEPATASDLHDALEELLRHGPLELHEDGEFIADLAGMQFEISDRPAGVFLHCWSEDRNLTRRVLGITARDGKRLALEVQKFGRARAGRLEISAASATRGPQYLTRGKFKARFQRLLNEQFPDERAEGFTSAADLEHSFSGSYTRGMMSGGKTAWAVIAASPAESARTVDAILTFGLLWLDWMREHAGQHLLAGLRVFLPEGAGALTAHRLRALADWVNVEPFELNETLGRARQIDPRDTGNVESWLSPHREALAARAAAQMAIDNITALAPQAIDVVVHPAPSGSARQVAFRFCGLEFARWQGGRLQCLDAKVEMADRWLEVSSSAAAPIAAIVRRLKEHRNPDAADRQHPLYRMAAERWLESCVLKDITRIDAQLDPAACYPQVPALAAGSTSTPLGAGRGVIDILGVTRDGRLAVIELKADEDLHLVLQGADYWLRVRWHQRQGDFHRYGYFSDRQLQDKPPLLFLVAPGLRFHPATDVLLKYVSKEIEVARVGLNEEWRKELKVIFRQ